MKNALHSAEGRKIGPYLQALRKKAGKTQRDVAKAMGALPSEIAKYEQGERRIDLVQFWLFCVACRTKPTRVAASLFRIFEEEGRPANQATRR